jgi:hypothetical protein
MWMLCHPQDRGQRREETRLQGVRNQAPDAQRLCLEYECGLLAGALCGVDTVWLPRDTSRLDYLNYREGLAQLIARISILA